MAKHYYNIELAVGSPLTEEDIQEIEDVIRLATERTAKISTEYVDSE